MQKIRGRKRMAAGTAPREFHPGPCLWVRRTMLCGRPMRESHYPACASSPTGCHTCFAARCSSLSCLVGVPSCGLATGSWRTGRPAQRRQIVSVCLILHRRPPAGLSLSRSYIGAPRGKGGNTQRPALGQFRSKPRMEIISFVSSRRRKSSSTWGRGKPSRS